jgi:hypothetical protein
MATPVRESDPLAYAVADLPRVTGCAPTAPRRLISEGLTRPAGCSTRRSATSRRTSGCGVRTAQVVGATRSMECGVCFSTTRMSWPSSSRSRWPRARTTPTCCAISATSRPPTTPARTAGRPSTRPSLWPWARRPCASTRTTTTPAVSASPPSHRSSLRLASRSATFATRTADRAGMFAMPSRDSAPMLSGSGLPPRRCGQAEERGSPARPWR